MAGFYEVSAWRRGWIGGDYNGSEVTERQYWRFPTEPEAVEFIERGGTAGWKDPYITYVRWDTVPIVKKG